jgi:hypothetical protein
VPKFLAKTRQENQSAAREGSRPDGTPEMSDAFNSRTITSGHVKDAWGTFFSGFAPVLDPGSGAPVAILGVDIKAAVVEGKLRQVTLLGVFAGVVLLTLSTAALLAMFQSRRALATVRQLQAELSRRNEELRGKDLFLG